MAKERGLRSSNDAKPWKCRCGKVNHPKKRRFFDVPAWECRGCKRKFNGSLKICLGEVEVDGGSLIGEPLDQGKTPYCVAFAYTKGVEVVERAVCVNNGTDPNKVQLINPYLLEQMFEEKYPDVPSKDAISKDYGLHRVLHMGLMLKEEGIEMMSSGDTYKLKDLSTIPRDDFSSIIDCMADGIPFVGTYLTGKRKGKLKYCQIYKSPPQSRYTQKRAIKKGHAVVLIGGGMEEGRKYFYCVNSWKDKFCPRKNNQGEIVKSGIGKIRACDLTKNVIKLSHPEKTDPRRRLVAQDGFDISKKNFILMMALKDQYTPMLRRAEQVNFEKNDDKVECDDLFEEFREDHLLHGPFCDDEAEYSSEEMEDGHMDHEKLHHYKLTNETTQPATPGAVNQGSNISSRADVIAAALRKHVEEEARDLSGNDLLRVVNQLYEQISSSVQSNDATENLLALHAINALVDLPFGGASKVAKLANFLKNVFEVKRDPEILFRASTVLGHLANVGGTLTAHEVERQIITTALGWLGEDRVEHRRFAAVLILKEMAENAFTVLKNYVPEFVDAILIASSDPKLVIREQAVEALRALLHSNMKAATVCTEKKVNLEGTDLISLLPNEILSTIISFLRTDDVVRTSVLSGHWYHLWRFAPLTLDTAHIRGNCPEQIEVVTKILNQHQGPVRRLHLHSLYFADLDGWFRSLALDNLQEIDIWVAKFDNSLLLSVLRFPPTPTLRVALVEHSLPVINSMDSPSLVKLRLVLVDIFGPAPLFLKSSEMHDDRSYVEPYLSLFNADFVPWCLDGKYNTCSSKIDSLFSLIQEECFFDQWCLIIKHTRAKQKGSVDHKISHANGQFELLTLILQKVRERIAGGKLKNMERSGSLPEHWRHDLLDSVAVSVFCDQPATDSHVRFLCAALAGSSQDDQICFLSAEAVCKIRGSIKSLASVLITSTFEWTKSSHLLLLPVGEQSLSANFEMAEVAFQVFERCLFALRTQEEDSVFSHILAALFIIEWECSMALTFAEESDLKGHQEEVNVDALMCNTSDDHLDETVHLKANLAEHIHAFRQSLIPSFWNDLHSDTLNRLVNILAQSVRYAVFDMIDLPIDRTAVLCSKWVVDMLGLICLDHIKLQSFFDTLLSEGEYWPLWVKPSLQNGHASVKIQREPLTAEGTELKHQRFIAFVDKLVLNLNFGEVILAPDSFFSRAWVAAEMICTWKWKGGSAFSTFLPSLVQYMKTEPCLEVSFVSLLLDTLLEGALMHASSNWALFNSCHLSDSEIEKIQDRYLRALVALLFTTYTKESLLRESDAHVLFEQLLSSLFIGSTVNRKCLRTVPFVMSTIIKPSTGKMRSIEASSCTDLLEKSILSWLEEAISCLSSSPREVAQQDIEDWMQVVLSCFPLKITGGTPKLVVKFGCQISNAETSLLLTLFSRYQTFYASADPSLSSRETMLSKTVELLGVKLTAVMVGYCWTKLGENDWCFVFRVLRKWIESSVLLVEEMTDSINDAVVNQTSAEDILENLKLIACTMEDLTFTFAESALVTLCRLNLVDNLHETDNSQNLQLIRSGEYAESNDKMMENILRLFLASGVSEAIAGSCSEEASSIIASSRVDYLHFWELVASFIINASPQIRRSALESMKLWGLTKESVSGLYSIIFSSEPIPHLQFAAYSLLMSEPLCQLSLVKGCSLGENPLSSQGSDMGQSIELMPDSEKSIYLRDELSALIEMPTSELIKTDLIARERVNVFVAWALVLSHLQLLPLSSTTRETVLQYVQDKISPCILDCIFQHIPLRTAAPSGKKKDVELGPEAKAAAEASKNAIVTCSLLPYVESLWPVGVLQMASLAGSLYGMMIRLLPSYVRTWFTSLRDRSLSYSIESFTRSWCSPPLLLDEFSQVKNSVYDSDETFSVSVNRSAYEIVATYKKEETGIDLVIRLPNCYPLRHVEVECTRSLGISEVKCRKWLLSLTSFVRNQNGAIAEAIRTWKSNFDKEFEGVEECPICYSILHTSNHSLPRLACKTCRHKFHGACLYKWFSTSNKSTCPLCQTPF